MFCMSKFRTACLAGWKPIGKQSMNIFIRIIKKLRKGYKQVSLAVQKVNYAVRMYEKVGFKTVDENAGRICFLDRWSGQRM